MKIPSTNPYLEFIKKHFQGEYTVNWHHNVMSYYLYKWVHGEIPFLIIEMPPQYGKSAAGAVMAAPYIFSEFPTARVAYATYGDDLVRRMSNDSKKIMRAEAYKEEFSDLTVPPAFRAYGYWENTLGGIYTGVGRDGGLSGTPQDFMICDDLFKNYKEAMSHVIREAVWYWFTTVALKRLSPQGRALLFFTRWSDDDVIGRCLKLRETSRYARSWVRISFPGLMTEEKFITKHPADPRQPGEPLWPWKETSADLEMSRLELGEAAFNAIVQQTPLNAGGTKIKSKWLKKISRSDVPNNLRWSRFYRFGELGSNTIDKNNATCLLAKTKNGDYIVSDMDYFSDDWPSCLDRLKRIGKAEKLVKVGFQKTGGKQTELFKQVEDCKPEVRRLKSFSPVNPLVWTPSAKAQKMLVVEDENTAKFLESCRNFTGSGKDKREAEIHALAGAYSMISGRRSIVQVFADKYAKKQAKEEICQKVISKD